MLGEGCSVLRGRGRGGRNGAGHGAQDWPQVCRLVLIKRRGISRRQNNIHSLHMEFLALQ